MYHSSFTREPLPTPYFIFSSPNSDNERLFGPVSVCNSSHAETHRIQNQSLRPYEKEENEKSEKLHVTDSTVHLLLASPPQGSHDPIKIWGNTCVPDLLYNPDLRKTNTNIRV